MLQIDTGQPGRGGLGEHVRHRLVPVSSLCQISHLFNHQKVEMSFRRDSTVCGVMGGTADAGKHTL